MCNRIIPIIVVFLVGCSSNSYVPKPSPGSGEGQNPVAPPPAVLPAAQPSQGPPDLPNPDQFAAALGLRVVSESADGSDPNVPDPRVDLAQTSSLDKGLRQGKEIHLRNTLFLRDPLSPVEDHRKELFFVWPENSLGVPLTAARYTHRIQKANGSQKGSLQSKAVSYDQNQKRFFIPLAELFGPGLPELPQDVQAKDTQWIRLDLTPQNGANIYIEIRFQAVGPLPVLRPISKTIDPPQTTQIFLKQISDEGWTIYQDELTNPNDRPFSLWAKFEKDSLTEQMRLEHFLKFPEFREEAYYPPKGPYWKYRLSTAKMDLFLEVHHQDGKIEYPEVSDVSSEGWMQFTLAARETIRLLWRVFPSDPVQKCSLPESQAFNFHWTVGDPPTYHKWNQNKQKWDEIWQAVHRLPSHCGAKHDFPAMTRKIANESGLGGFDPDRPEPDPASRSLRAATRTVDWSIAGARLAGKWSREVRIAHPFTQEAHAIAPVPSVEVLNAIPWESHQSRTDVGEVQDPASLTLFGCQGIFF